ncbi:hypothetical protein Ami103574_10175 [Aminipila butyrica]|uniref:ABC exporter n=1 Tax=Aminipila butyrica TaxID=433296 RepID=A0A858BX46_9FIRM|nr:putative ABC exporter domain-containing protein [Aminipila butyrica]QIB69665.1 hypothetical protein Ami103574_10175 [Aminipila butyrica]
MSSLFFLLIRNVKNNFLELLRKPAKLILWIFVIAMLGGMLVLSTFTRESGGNALDIFWLKGILFLLVMFFVVLAIQKGLSNGDVIFDMSDVNLLFVSPVSPRLILMYGIVRMAKMAFWAGFFILFQSNSLSSSFGIGFQSVLILLLGFILAVCLLQILSLLIYSLTNGKPGRKLLVKVISVLVFLPLIVYFGMQFLRTGKLILALHNTLLSPVASWTPVAGWASEGAISLISGQVGNGLLFFGLMVVAGALLILYIALSNPDYYEDVLVATETAFEKKRVVSEGQINTEASSTRKVKVSKTGISGFGASTIFYKHLRESFRANRFGLWGLSSVFSVLGAALFALFLRGEGGGLITLLQVLMWMQIFLIGTGRGLKELYMHYIYLIPDSSFRKIVWSNLEIMFKVLVESIFVFCIAGFIMKASFLLILTAIAVYTLFSFLLLGINYLSLRFTGADISAGLLIVIYMIAVIVIMLPGLVAAFVISFLSGGGSVLLGCGALALWELFAGLVCFAFSKGVLHSSDMPVLKTGKR